MKSLPIIWQRLVSSGGKTCDRCHATYQEMQHAISKLKEALRPLGIEPTLEIREINEKSFKANPSESNRIWIAGRPMEEWLDARVGSSRCCSVCGETECRTVEVGGTTFEAIPEKLFLKAALVASSQLLDLTPEAPPR
ncbi:MAG: heavy metal sensor signal transduction histidine kinase [Methylobacter sp.]|nr:MAG: heavy metal sensor signal transduction histidine kinase [Methylobacter sp.]